MVRYTKKNKRGGDKLQDIQSQLNTIQEQVNELKNPRSESIFEPVPMSLSEPVTESVFEPIPMSVSEPVTESVFEPVPMPASEPVTESVFEPVPMPTFEPVSVFETVSKVIPKKPISKSWVTNKEIKFKDGDNGRVLLAFSRVISHIDNNIKKSSVTKDWRTIKEKLINANSENEVQDIINQYKVKFASNYVLGGKTKKKGKRNKRKTHKRH
jgi:hypothetical protein